MVVIELLVQAKTKPVETFWLWIPFWHFGAEFNHYSKFLRNPLITQYNATKLNTCVVYKQVRSRLMRSRTVNNWNIHCILMLFFSMRQGVYDWAATNEISPHYFTIHRGDYLVSHLETISQDETLNLTERVGRKYNTNWYPMVTSMKEKMLNLV